MGGLCCTTTCTSPCTLGKTSRSCRFWHCGVLQGDPSVSILGALGMLSSPCCLITGIACILQNCWGLGLRGKKAARLPASEVCAGGRDQGDPVGKLRGLAKHRSCASISRVFTNRISTVSRLNTPCLGFNFPPWEGLIFKSKTTVSCSVQVLGASCDELVRPLLVLGL